MQRTSIGRKIAICTAAAAAGAWLAFHPLASPAQGARAQQQKKTGQAAVPKAPEKARQISFSDAQKAQQKRDTANEVLTLRLMEENADSANLRQRVLDARAYADWVYDTLKNSRRIKPNECERFINEADNVLHYSDSKKIRFGSTETDFLSSAMSNRFLFSSAPGIAAYADALRANGIKQDPVPTIKARIDSLKEGEGTDFKIDETNYFVEMKKGKLNTYLIGVWDCDNTVSLLFDVGRRLGLPVAAVFVSTGYGAHVVLQVGKFFMEPSGDYYCKDTLDARYHVYLITSDPAAIASTGYENLGEFEKFAAKRESDPVKRLAGYRRAVEMYSRAIRIAPEVGIFYRHRAFCLQEIGQCDSAASDLRKAVLIEPSNRRLRLDLADAYFWLGRYKEAIFEYSTVQALHPRDAEAQKGIDKCFDALRGSRQRRQ